MGHSRLLLRDFPLLLPSVGRDRGFQRKPHKPLSEPRHSVTIWQAQWQRTRLFPRAKNKQCKTSHKMRVSGLLACFMVRAQDGSFGKSLILETQSRKVLHLLPIYSTNSSPRGQALNKYASYAVFLAGRGGLRFPSSPFRLTVCVFLFGYYTLCPEI